MTESLKIAEIHRTNIEYERQRHLANWLIKSSPHMAKPPPPLSASTSTSQTKSIHKNGGITQNPLFFLSKCTSGPQQPPQLQQTQLSGGALSMSHAGIFNSQTNLPLQIVTATQDGHKPKLRRFNSHDTSANMFSVADFENARLARRNELELKQRLHQQQHQQQQLQLKDQQQSQQHHRYKMNSLSSGGDYSTGDSKGSKFSIDSHPEILPADVFLDRYSLPRVVRITAKLSNMGKFDETMQSNSSNGSNTSSGGNNNNATNSISKQQTGNKDVIRSSTMASGGELYMLFRHIEMHRMFHGINAKNSVTRKKGVVIPQEFQGYFSLVNEKGAAIATMYTTLVQLVRERVYKFLSVDNLPAYSESSNTDGLSSRPHYVKGTARGGQIFRLLAVFEDGKQDSSTNQSNAVSFREKDKGRYAQLLNENRQIVYVSLTTKGKFYEIEPTTPQILQQKNITTADLSSPTVGNSAAASIGNSTMNKSLNPDCVHRLNTIVSSTESGGTFHHDAIPLTVRFIAGPQGSSAFIPETMTINNVTIENIVVACPIDELTETRSTTTLVLKKLQVNPQMMYIKSFLGFENEQKLFGNHNIQNILKFCQMNYDNFIRQLEHESITIVKNGSCISAVGVSVASGSNNSATISNSSGNRNGTVVSKSKSDGGLKILKPLNLPKLLRREKSMIAAHEREDSIIFLSKSDLENLENKEQQQQRQRDCTTTLLGQKDKLKVFQTTKKKWFRNLKPASKTNSVTSFDLDIKNKRMSLDRYQDMSKLLQERFGNTTSNANNAADVEDDDDDSEHIVQQTTSNHHSSGNARPSSEIGIESVTRDHINQSELRQKSMSLQEVDSRTEYNNVKPDLLKVGVASCSTYKSTTVNKNQNPTFYGLNDQERYSNRDVIVADNNSISCDGTTYISFNNQQQSFITEKLYNEFHVKTKHHSKSSASLQHLLHFSIPHKMHINELRKKSIDIDEKTAPQALSTEPQIIGGGDGNGSNNNNNHQLLDNFDDLPYSNVRDSLVLENATSSTAASRDSVVSGRDRKSSVNSSNDLMENIYAEIYPNDVTISTMATTTTTAAEVNDVYLVNKHDGHSRDAVAVTAAINSNISSNSNSNNRALRISVAGPIQADNNTGNSNDVGIVTTNQQSTGIVKENVVDTKHTNLYNSLRY